MKKGEYVLMKKAYVLMTQWKADEPQIAGVFSSFDRAVVRFVLDRFRNSDLPLEKLAIKIARVALKMAHLTDDEDFADFGDTRAWIEEREIDERYEVWERGGGDDGR